MNITEEDIKLIEKLIDIKNRGYYANGTEVTELHNKVLGSRLSPTNCGSCIRARIQDLENALNRYRREIENKAKIQSSNELKEEDGTTARESENKAAEAKIKDRMAKVRAARGKKK